MFNLIGSLINSLGYIITVAFFITRIQGFKKLIKKKNYTKLNTFLLGTVFSILAISGTYSGTNYMGAIANTRNISVVAAAIVGGPFIGLITGFVAGLHRILIDPYGITSIPCGIATFLGGWGVGYLSRLNIKKKYIVGFLGGFLIENLSMLLILVISKPFNLAYNIVGTIYFPMVFINALGIAIVILITENVILEEDRIAGEEARLVLEITNKTLPYFRDVSEDSLRNVCEIIAKFLGAKNVVLTDRENIVANYAEKKEDLILHKKIRGQRTKEVIKSGKVKVVNRENEIGCSKNGETSFVIAPLTSRKGISGTLKVYFFKDHDITEKHKNLILGLSNIISTQLEISKVKKLEEMAREAEIKALQSQINPHFLFNALNTVTSFVRTSPDQARDTIINLSTYLRYNLDNNDKFVDIRMELEQLEAYVSIEKSRFKSKINMHYEVEEETKIVKIPSLTIQPLVENAIQHGILKGGGKNIFLKIYFVNKKKVKIVVENDGKSIEKEIIEKVNSDGIEEGKIGLYNVHRRIKLIYGKGLEITRLGENNGTKITFEVEEE